MISILFVLPYDKKNVMIRRVFEAQAQQLGLGRVRTAEWNSTATSGAAYTAKAEYPITVVDITMDGGLEFAQSLRGSDDNLLLLLIADTKVSPMKYMKASIRAQALLLKPWNMAMLQQVSEDFLSLFMNRDGEEKADELSLLVEYDGERRMISYRDILYVEARNKKIYVRTQDSEYGMYGTLEKVGESLPECFIRCHRSYIVNSTYLVSARMAENTLFLRGKITVPISRTYKAAIKEKLNGSAVR